MAVVIFAAGMLVGSRLGFPRAKPGGAQNVPEPLRQFWSQFIGERDIILAYTNAVFLETDSADLLRFRNSGAVADRGARRLERGSHRLTP